LTPRGQVDAIRAHLAQLPSLQPPLRRRANATPPPVFSSSPGTALNQIRQRTAAISIAAAALPPVRRGRPRVQPTRMRNAAPSTLHQIRDIAADASRNNLSQQPSAFAEQGPAPQEPPPPPVARLPIVEDKVPSHNLGRMNVVCLHCGAFHWMAERHSKSSNINPTFGQCCLRGQIQLPKLEELPQPLRTLFEDADDESAKEFRKNIRKYNAALAFTSVQANIDESLLQGGGGPYVWRLHGALYHMQGPLIQDPEHGPARYAQLYFFDPDEAFSIRMENNHDSLRHGTLSELQEFIHQHNPYVSLYKQAGQRLEEHRIPDAAPIQARLTFLAFQDPRRYNLPTTNELAIVLPGDGSTAARRDILLELQGGGLKHINSGNALYAPLAYPLFFPKGETGWHYRIPKRQTPLNLQGGINPNLQEDLDRTSGDPNDHTQKWVTEVKYYAYRFHPRLGESTHIFRGQKLFQQFIVDAWASAEQNRLAYLEHHQKDLRADSYRQIAEAFHRGDSTTPDQLGKRVILPASFTGSSRDFKQNMQKSLTIARKLGNASLFITMTCNPHWKEIQDELLPGQTAADRPDLVTRVFQLKKKALLKDIYEKRIFGSVPAYVYCIEFQKRGLPHMHLLVWLEDQFKPRTPEDVDSIISAKIPDKNTQPRLFETVTQNMVHGPCGPGYPKATCMKDGKCSKGFPKKFREETSIGNNGYPEYARPKDGPTFEKNGFTYTNEWVVPYCAWLSLKYGCHINVEVTFSIRSIKYIHKYIYKGHDRTTMEFYTCENEVKQYLDARYISAHEGIYRIWEHELHKQVRSDNYLRSTASNIYDSIPM
jgi:hypothetical protein